jgi:hypothetical protein
MDNFTWFFQYLNEQKPCKLDELFNLNFFNSSLMQFSTIDLVLVRCYCMLDEDKLESILTLKFP